MTTIEWTDKVWNPVTGCTKVSQGCKHCYAETIAKRFWGERKFSEVICHFERLGIPLKWKKPRRVFVNSMSDLFHESVPFDFIDMVFAVMQKASSHTFQVLTKRPERMHKYFSRLEGEARFAYLDAAMEQLNMEPPKVTMFPFPNVWLGVSVENQDAAEDRIPWLLQAPAAVRFVSCEPLLGELELTILKCYGIPCVINALSGYSYDSDTNHSQQIDKLDWVIVGGESGIGARPMKPEWVRKILDDCIATDVPFFFKQWGGRNKKAAGRLLDGREWSEYPAG